MKYFLDQEFHEYFIQHRQSFMGKAKPRHVIDLISIGLIGEDGREYYAISKEFDLLEAWNNEWLRENVLLNIFKEVVSGDMRNYIPFDLKNFQRLIVQCGKTNEQIANEIKQFCDPEKFLHNTAEQKLEFYGYFADYDWVVFCSLFGSMMQLPTGFPMYCRDLKQMVDDIEHVMKQQTPLFSLKKVEGYPQQYNEHNALADSKWNIALYRFIKEFSRNTIAAQYEI